jgi:hypothetical protein
MSDREGRSDGDWWDELLAIAEKQGVKRLSEAQTVYADWSRDENGDTPEEVAHALGFFDPLPWEA